MRVVLTGASGQLGTYLLVRLNAESHTVFAWAGPSGGSGLVPVELADPDATEAALNAADPDVILHAAAVSRVEAVRVDPVRAHEVNVAATGRLASWCGRLGRKIVYTSTDLVFDGSRPWWDEADRVGPLLAYGRSKAEAEPLVLAVPGGLVARMSLLFGPSRSPGRSTYLDAAAAGLRRGEPQTFFEDEFRTPLSLADAADALVRLAASGVEGVVHVGGPERVSRYDLARRVAAVLGFDERLVRPNRQSDMTFTEPRPADVSLDTTRLAGLFPDLPRPAIEDAARALWDSAEG